MKDETPPKKFKMLPGLFGSPGALVMFVTKSEKDVITPHIELIEGVNGRDAQFKAEQRCEKLQARADVVRILLCAVVAESRLESEVTPERGKVNGKRPG